MIPRPAQCQCLSSFISFILHFFVIPTRSPRRPVLLRGSAVCTRCSSSSPDDYIDRVGGWVEARETVARYVVYLSPERRREKREVRRRKRETWRRKRGRDRNRGILSIVISTPIRTFIAEVTRIRMDTRVIDIESPRRNVRRDRQEPVLNVGLPTPYGHEMYHGINVNFARR